MQEIFSSHFIRDFPNNPGPVILLIAILAILMNSLNPALLAVPKSLNCLLAPFPKFSPCHGRIKLTIQAYHFHVYTVAISGPWWGGPEIWDGHRSRKGLNTGNLGISHLCAVATVAYPVVGK